jgi:eukaryotic-like serine/threonine-protein kinase
MSIIWSAVKYALARGPLYGLGLGAILGTVFYPVIGTLYGLFFGGVTGTILGIPLGALVGWISYQFFHPLTNPNRYRWTLFIVCWVASEIGATICLVLINGTWAVGDYDLSSVVFFQIPALIAAGAAIYAGQGFADRYIDTHYPSDSVHPLHSETKLMRGKS